MADVLSFKDITEIGANIATILGVPIAIFLFIRERNKEQSTRALEAYDRLDERFVDYVKLCLDAPDLDTFEVSLSGQGDLSSEEIKKRKEIMMFTILIAIFERAYVTYMKEDSKHKPISDWQVYIRYWCAKEHFQKAWETINITNQLANQPGVEDIRTGYNIEFIEQINAWIKESKLKAGRHGQSGKFRRLRN